MNIVIYATCHGIGIKHYLNYFLNVNIELIFNYSSIAFNKEIDYNIIKNADIFIYQPIPAKFGKYSTDLTVENNILNYISDKCIKITIPYVYAEWLWGLGKIQLRDGTGNFDKIDNETEEKIKFINKEVILNYKKNNYTLEYILNQYDKGLIDFNYELKFNEGINILKNKEKLTDVKISDFIINNYKKYELFTMPNHPTKYIFKEMTKQILKKIIEDFDENRINDIDDVFVLSPIRIPYSSYDLKYHNFNFNIIPDDEFIKNIIKMIFNSLEYEKCY
jgi:hypothetical protein